MFAEGGGGKKEGGFSEGLSSRICDYLPIVGVVALLKGCDKPVFTFKRVKEFFSETPSTGSLE